MSLDGEVGVRVIGRLAVVLIAAIGLSLVSPASAQAGLDNELSLIDGQGRTMTVQQWDTHLNGVFPLDRNRLTREWFHSGRALYEVTGDGAEDFEGVLELGYQIGFPWSMGVGVNFAYTTPNVNLDQTAIGVFDLIPVDALIFTTPPLFPGASISADLGNGPGIQEVATFSVDVAGPKGGVAVNNAHGTVTGAMGGVLLRPFARLISNQGDSVTTYGAPHDMK